MHDDVSIKESSLVKVTKMNNIIEVQHSEKINRFQTIQKISKTQYVELSTGEIKEFALNETRKDNINSLRKTLKKLRYLINNNFQGLPNELFITLTYNYHMTNTETLYKDYKRFMTRLKRYMKDTTIDYINVIEPHASGRWHCHVLVRFNQLNKIYIPNEELAAMWGQGFVTIKSLKNVDNIGAYLSAYLSDLEIDSLPEFVEKKFIENKGSGKVEIITKVVEGQEKKFIKGGRLHFYPTGVNMFRKSKGIVYPEREEMYFSQIKKIVGSAKPNYSKVYEYENKENDFRNTTTFLQYNLKKST